MKRLLVSIIVLSAGATLAGCASVPAYHHWTLANGNPIRDHAHEFNSDWYACVRENIPPGEQISQMTAREMRSADAMSVQCMKARGYQLAWSDNSPDAPTAR